MTGLLESLGLNSALGGAAVSLAILVVGLLLALIVHKAVFPLVIRLTNLSPTNVDARLVGAIRAPLTVAVLALGVYLAVEIPLPLSPEQDTLVHLAGRLVGIAILVWAGAQAISETFQWYIDTVAPRTGSSLDDRLLPLMRRVASALVVVMGGLLVLDQLNVNISPLIAGLGLGGLAVALALQPTLANVFAGTYVMTEGVVAPGDYIELENGIAGYVIDVSWRSTRLRTWYNNLVVVPNAKFAETIITNYQRPQPAVNVFLTCGVSYDSDLHLVQRVCEEVMNELLDTDPDAIKEYGGWFGFESFGESNVDFWLFVQARDRLASFTLRTKLMQNLHSRLLQEGIVINYPMRKLQFPSDWSPNGTPGGVRPETNTAGPRRRPRRRAARQDTHDFPTPSVDRGSRGDAG